MITESPSTSNDDGASSLSSPSRSGWKRDNGSAAFENSSVSAMRPTRSTCLTIWYFFLTVGRSMFFELPKMSLMILNT